MIEAAIRAAAVEAPPTPIPMVLHCPECRTRHIDEGEFATKPHHTHACQGCGLTWRPAIVPTVGVQFLPGFKNPSPERPTEPTWGYVRLSDPCQRCGQFKEVCDERPAGSACCFHCNHLTEPAGVDYRAVQSVGGVWFLWRGIPVPDDGDNGGTYWETIGLLDMIPAKHGSLHPDEIPPAERAAEPTPHSTCCCVHNGYPVPSHKCCVPGHAAEPTPQEPTCDVQAKNIADRLLAVRSRLIGEGYTQGCGIELNAIADELRRLSAPAAAPPAVNVDELARELLTTAPNITGERVELWLAGSYRITSSEDVDDVLTAAEHIREGIAAFIARHLPSAKGEA